MATPVGGGVFVGATPAASLSVEAVAAWAAVATAVVEASARELSKNSAVSCALGPSGVVNTFRVG